MEDSKVGLPEEETIEEAIKLVRKAQHILLFSEAVEQYEKDAGSKYLFLAISSLYQAAAFSRMVLKLSAK